MKIYFCFIFETHILDQIFKNINNQEILIILRNFMTAFLIVLIIFETNYNDKDITCFVLLYLLVGI